MKTEPEKKTSPSKADKERDNLLKEFRAFLHLAITAKQTDQEEKLAALPGPRMQDYCRELVKLPDNTLALELWRSMMAILDQISELSFACEDALRCKDEESVEPHASARRILDQLDFALALVLRNFLWFAKYRAGVTQCSDLLCDVLAGIAIGDGGKAADLVRRYQKLHPEEDGTDGGFPDSFAWDVYQRVAELDNGSS